MALALKHTIAPPLAELDPNAAAPVPERVIEVGIKDGQSDGGTFKLLALLADGISATLATWAKVADTSTWVRLHDPVVAYSKQVRELCDVQSAAELFIQVVAVAGPATKLGLTLV